MISIFDLFKIGVGPSSSHTMGPMVAAADFARRLSQDARTTRVAVTLFGSLAWTGRGHATDRAVCLGLAGFEPATLDPDEAERVWTAIRAREGLRLSGRLPLAFDLADDLVFDMETVPPEHPNTLAFAAFDARGETLAHERWLSVGGGFVLREGAEVTRDAPDLALPHPFRSGADLLDIGRRTGLSIAGIMRANESALRDPSQVAEHVERVASTMFACVERGLSREGLLPGDLKVKRRAAQIHAQILDGRRRNAASHLEAMDLLSVFAMAVNEENAAGGRVVTAPTNGAAGVFPAVLRYYRDHVAGASRDGVETMILTAGAIGALFKMNASISGAEVGCQGEVGVASSMAAAALAAALGGTNEQIENAAEIAMEHHLGMTCDPVGGLVQIPCIERNAFGAVKAVTAASLALKGDGVHKISLDQAIATMRQTGADMHDKYKETSCGGLAVNWIEC